ncbi:response regulator [Rubinisphaera sp.]|uniref:PP2C family protein-serine/threonine phosphatase n=1 Tax=Rubinisphaera sp. TaxID=2024857 RepID=UPI000C107038|nr:response regulator [Rubinisphaera sp.]MBV10380.1 regulator [Rubinisphaera sp.]|tara:strand:+ start:2289 stop:3479 length:1191 start_codon:yes stop_codon:yes gene_type:complete
MRVLVGWDDADEAELLKLYLDVDDTEVEVHTTWDDFLAAAKKDPSWDVFLISTSSPDVDTAYEAFMKLREVSADHAVVGASSQEDVYRIARFLTTGLRSYVIRDHNKDYMFLLHAALQSAMESVRAERERVISAKLRQEIDSVRKLQESIIPRLLNVPKGYQIEGRYESSEINVYGGLPVTMAGGDYYNALTMPDGNIALLVGDASGHGMKACMSIMTLHTLIQMFPSKRYTDPAVFVRDINESLCSHAVVNDDGGFITLLYGILNPVKHEFEWAAAGHPLPMVHDLTTNTLDERGSTDDVGMPLGIWEEAEYVSQKIDVPEHSRLALYSDGLAEAFCDDEGHHVEFGVPGIKRVLQESVQSTLKETVEALFQSSHAFTQGLGRHDDTSVLIVQRD